MQIIDRLLATNNSPIPLSYSKASLLLDCGRFFKLRYLEKRRQNDSAVLDPQAARVGKFCHSVMENSMIDAMANGFDLEKIDFGMAWQSADNGLDLCSTEMDRATEMRSNMRDIIGRLFALINNYDLKCYPELRFCLSKTGQVRYNVPYRDRIFIGFIDFWGVTKKRRAGILLDYKSHGKSDENDETLRLQTTIYLFHMFKMYPHMQTIQTGGVYLPDNLIDLHPIVRRDQLPKIENEFSAMIEKFLEKYDRSDFEPVKSKYCNWCGYIDTCPVGGKNGKEKK